ncbi:acetyl-CoA carboxylase biotin carboxylase subunit [Cumulibacter soli]|uniref:acetyl-CoA carboxylase biotin carboxylase subunit n=1 Tax=Cumulibacter soli TaxID=2546344 RepID=UPI001067F1E4|nr:biotin carboxylase N-terminal domain-containing protein [Cumulibacter soli]
MSVLFDSVLIANRGEIARRVIRTCKELGVRSIAIFDEIDRELPFVAEADESVSLGSGRITDTYLNGPKITDIATRLDASAVHPGYGFLSESADFARAITQSSAVWIGPTPELIAMMGDKSAAREVVSGMGVPVAAGSYRRVDNEDIAVQVAASAGLPVMVKPALGGGGIGMQVATTFEGVRSAYAAANSHADRLFGGGGVVIEQFIQNARHIEVQVLGLNDGSVIVLGDRDCSVQRRHQKVVEEAPATGLTVQQRSALHEAARTVGQAIEYRGAGTVEFLIDTVQGTFVFCEMNTRLQVEHPVTELITGIDLVAEQLRVACGDEPGFVLGEVSLSGHAIELRINAEDPLTFRPSPGQIVSWQEPSGAGIRVESAYQSGNTVTPVFDPLLAKLCVHADTRSCAIERASSALERFRIEGPKTNHAFLETLLSSPQFQRGGYDTRIVEDLMKLIKEGK